MQHFSHQVLFSGAQDVQIQTLKSLAKVTWKQAWKKTQKFVKGLRKAFKMRSPNPPKINKNPSLDPKTSFLVLPGAPGSSHGHPGCKSGGTSLPNVRLWTPKSTVSVSKITIMRKKSDMKTNIQKPANHHTFQQRKELPKHLKPASPTNLASQHHSQHNTATTPQPSSLEWGPAAVGVAL